MQTDALLTWLSGQETNGDDESRTRDFLLDTTGTLTTELHPQIKKYSIFKVLVNLRTAETVFCFVVRFVLHKYYTLYLENVKGFSKVFCFSSETPFVTRFSPVRRVLVLEQNSMF